MLEILMDGRVTSDGTEATDLITTETKMMTLDFVSQTTAPEVINFLSWNISYRIVDQSNRVIATYEQTSAQESPVAKSATIPTGVTSMTVYSTPYSPAGISPNSSNAFRLEATTSNPGNTSIVGIRDWEKAQVRHIRFTDFHGLKNVPTAISPQITSLSYFVFGCKSFNSPNVNSWNTKNIRDFERVFSSCPLFNQPLTNWKTGNGVTFNAMFSGASAFTGDLKLWDMSKAEDTGLMFYLTKFNSDISKWNTQKLKIMRHMFNGCTLFNQDLSKWNVLQVTDHAGYDQGATAWLPQYKPQFAT